MNDLSIRVRDYLDRKKPARKVVMTDDVKTEVERVIIYRDRPINPVASLFKIGMWTLGGVMVIWAISVVEMQNRCYLDKACRAEIERVNR